MHDLIILVLSDIAYLFTIEPFNYVYAAVIVCLIVVTLKRAIS